MPSVWQTRCSPSETSSRQRTCSNSLQEAFEQSKLNITKEIEKGVRIFDKSKPTCLATDWSKHEIGFWLFQKHCPCPSNDLFCCKQGWKISLVGSRFTHPDESKARHFVLGCKNLTIVVDHRPLLEIFSDRSLDQISKIRLRNLKEKTPKYQFRRIHISSTKTESQTQCQGPPQEITTQKSCYYQITSIT